MSGPMDAEHLRQLCAANDRRLFALIAAADDAARTAAIEAVLAEAQPMVRRVTDHMRSEAIRAEDIASVAQGAKIQRHDFQSRRDGFERRNAIGLDERTHCARKLLLQLRPGGIGCDRPERCGCADCRSGGSAEPGGGGACPIAGYRRGSGGVA